MLTGQTVQPPGSWKAHGNSRGFADSDAELLAPSAMAWITGVGTRGGQGTLPEEAAPERF